jgi:subtilisin family serine protease
MSNKDKVLPIRIRDHILDFSSLSSDANFGYNSETYNSETETEVRNYIVQFKRSLTRDEQEKLRLSLGLELKYYISDYAYLEILNKNKLKKIENEKLVHLIVHYEARLKHSRYLLQSIYEIEKSESNKGISVVVILFHNVDLNKTLDRISNICKIEKTNNTNQFGDFPRLGVRLFNSSEFNKLIEMEEVYTVCGSEEVELDNGVTSFTIQSGMPGCTPIWDCGLHGEGQIIGIIDSVVDVNHCFFKDAFDNTIRPAHRKIVGFRSSTSAPVRHGTFVSGIAMGDDVNQTGSHPNRGIACSSRLTFANVFERDQGDSTKSMLALLSMAMIDGAFIHSNSWHQRIDSGMPQYSSISFDVDKFTWENEYNIVVASASKLGGTLGPPGTSKNALCVTASKKHPHEMYIGDGAIGPTSDGRRKPEIAAPGCDISSSVFNTSCDVFEMSVCATSWSSPAVAGALALIRQYYLEGYYPSGKKVMSDSFIPSGALLKATIINCGINMTGETEYPNNIQGWGLVLLSDTLYFEGNIKKLKVFDVNNVNGLCTGEIKQYYIEVMTNSLPLKVTLVFNDPPPAFPDVHCPVVNNLDLKMISPDNSQTYFGNVFSGNISITGGAGDTLNNVETILIPNPDPGIWTMEVMGVAVNVAAPGQGFAVVITGDVGTCNFKSTVKSINFDAF